MNQIPQQKTKTKKKFLLFVLFIILLIAGFSALWFWAASKVDETVNNVSNNLKQQGSILNCVDQDVRGYPFRLGVFCSSLSFSDPDKNINASVGKSRTAAQLYKPGHIIAELDSPLSLSVPNLAPLIIKWADLQSSANLTTSSYKRISIEANKVDIAADDAGFESPLAKIKNLQIHSRPTPKKQDEGSLDFSLALTDWEISNGPDAVFEPIYLGFNVSMEQAQYIIQTKQGLIPFLRTNGGKGSIENFTIATNSGGELQLSGPIEVAQNGLINGDITLNLTDPKKLAVYAGNIFPPIKAGIEQALPFLDGFAEKNGDQIKIKDLQLSIRNSEVFLGFFKVAHIPKLF